MPNYRVVFLEPLGETPVRSISFEGEDAGQALLLAQNHDGPAELWREDQRVCTLVRTGNCGELWVISNREPAGAQKTVPSGAGGTFMLRAGFGENASKEHPVSDQKRHDDPPIKTKAANPSLNSELKGQTEIQSQVSPEDYPAEKRRQQVAAATGAGGTGKSSS
jgi:hypothetical protein